MAQSIYTHILDNGLALVAEPMDWLESAAFTLVLPAGCALDPIDRLGLSNFACEMAQRGCGSRDSRQFIEDLERLGAADRSAAVSAVHTSFGAAVLADNVLEVLSIYADLIQRPHLPAEQLEEARQVCLQEVRAIDDDPAQKVMQELRERHYPEPWGRATQGTQDTIEAIDLDSVRQHIQQTYHAGAAILSVAGKLDWDQLKEHVEQQFGDWSAVDSTNIKEQKPRGGAFHIPHQSNQTHIGIAYDSVPYGHPDYFQARGAVGILSDGMSSRLFTEVRENRGLCYSVYASCHSYKDRGSVLCYAATSAERAQETLDVTLSQLTDLAKGVRQDELHRLKSRIKSALIMQQESSASRSTSIAVDWYYLGRVQTLDELGRIIDALSCESINSFLKDNPPGDFTIATLGEQQLEVRVAVS